MKRRQPDLAAVGAEQLLDPAAHFLGGLVGERHGQHFAGRRVAAAHEVRDAVRDDARLSRPGARENQRRQRPVGLQDGVALSGQG